MSIIHEPPYRKLLEDLSKERKIIYLTYGGSHAYGTNVEESDIDIRGIALKTKRELLGSQGFEQFINQEADMTIYAVDKFIQLASNMNPNIIEFFGTKQEHRFLVADEAKMILDNQDIFISQKAINSFGGYAGSQLRRMENSLSTNTLQSDKEKHILQTLNNMEKHLQTHYTSYDKANFKLHQHDSKREGFNTEIFVDIDLKDYPLRDFYSIQSEMTSAISAYDKLNHRNSKKSEKKLDKHVMHLIRLYLMLFDILEKGQIITYRVNEIELLMDVRNGGYSKNNYEKLYDLLDVYEKRLEYAKLHTNIPEKPDYKKIDELLITINEISLKYRQKF